MALFSPSTEDVCDVRAILASRKLPNELILAILDHARYWVEFTRGRTQFMVLMDEDFSRDYSAARSYYALPAFPVRSDPDDEVAKIKEVEFLVVGHDQGWTTEDTKGTYQTSSWFEVSILRPRKLNRFMTSDQSDPSTPYDNSIYLHDNIYPNLHAAVHAVYPLGEVQLVQRPSLEMEPQRLHCDEMMYATASDHDPHDSQHQTKREGEDAWYLQGNEVAKGQSVFEGEMVRRYNIVWSSALTPRWVGNEGSGRGEGFVDALQEGDWILVWARAKRRGWENHIHGVRMTIRSTI